MSERLSCHTCQSPITNGTAILRGQLDEQRAFHPGACFDTYRAEASIPAQRPQPEPKPTLAERLRAGRAS